MITGMCFHNVAPNRGVIFFLRNPTLRCSEHSLSALRFYLRKIHTVRWGSANLYRIAPQGKIRRTLVKSCIFVFAQHLVWCYSLALL